MEFIKIEHGLILKVDKDVEKMLLEQLNRDKVIDTDAAMYEFFDYILPDTEWEWISPEDIAALTSAPILGIKDKDDNVIEAYGFMNYAIESLLGTLLDHGEAILRKG